MSSCNLAVSNLFYSTVSFLNPFEKHSNFISILVACFSGLMTTSSDAWSYLSLIQEDTLPLSWGNRLKIALGAAKGLAFLHESEKPVIYRDFKTSNILVDSVCI